MTKKFPRVATDEDMPAPPMTVSEAVKHGSRIEQLVAMRRVAAAAIDAPETPPRELKSLMISVNAFSKEIEALEAQEHEAAEEALRATTTVDERWRPEAI